MIMFIGSLLGGISSALGVGSVVGDIAAPLVTGFLAEEGADDRNEAQIASAREQMQFQAQQKEIEREFNAAEAAKNRRFQRTLSNNAVRRAVRDMRRAGINPILAAKHGASSPGGATASTSGAAGAMANIENARQAGINSAMAARRLNNEMTMMKEQVIGQKQVNKNLIHEGEKIRSQAALNNANAAKAESSYHKDWSDIDLNTAKENMTRQQERKLKQETENLVHVGKTLKKEGDFNATTFAEILRYVDAFINAISPMSGMMKGR